MKDISDEYIVLLFQKMLQQLPLLDDKEIRILLNKVSPPSPSSGFSKYIKHIVKPHLKLLIMTTLSSIIISAILLLNGREDNTNYQPQKQIKSEVSTTKVNDYANKTLSQKQVYVKPSKGTSTWKIDEGMSSVDQQQVKPFTWLTSTNQSESDLIVQAPLGKPDSIYNGDEYILDLSKEELKNLGILISDSGLFYLNITPEGIISEFNRPSYNLRDGRKGELISEKVGNSENLISFRTFYVCYSTNYQVTNSDNKFSVSVCNELKSLYPKSNQGSLFYYRSDKSEESQRIFSKFDSFKESKDRVELNSFSNGQLMKFVDDTLVPVLIQDKNRPISESKILWFVTNNDFYNALPKRCQERVRNFYEHNKLLKKKYPNLNLVEYKKNYQLYDYLESANYIDLTKEELARIGIKFDDIGMGYYDKNGHVIWAKNSDLILESNPAKINKREFYAAYYSTVQGKGFYEIKLGNTDDKSKVNDLVPIRVKKDLPADYKLSDDIIFWYTPTEAFFDSLPSRISQEMRKEYNIILIKRDPKVSVKEKSQLSSSCKYFEECRSTLFSVDFTVSPNPIADNVNINIKLQQPEKLSISVFSIGGSKLMSLMPFSEMQAGQHQFSFSLSSLHSNIYLITVQNSKGQFKTQRIIKL